MREIKNVLICGIGAVGSIYANKINKNKNVDLKILVDKSRYEKYKNSPKIFNGKTMDLEYVLPENNDFKPDLIIIATKYDAIFEVRENIKNFVKEDTIIISLLNGVTSEEILAERYGWEHIILSYFIGHSAMRNGNNITFDGTGNIVFGINNAKNTDKNDVLILKNFFDKVDITYKTPEDMYRALWLKFMLNVSSNQTSAIFGTTFRQMQSNKKFRQLLKNIMEEVVLIAKAKGVKNTDTMIYEAFAEFDKMLPDGKTSMLQDIESKRKTEVEMFAGTVIELGEKYNIPTHYNKILKEMIEVIEEDILQ